MIKYLKKRISLLDDHTLEVVIKSSAATGVKILGIIAALFVSITMGRTLGAEGLGVINLAMRITSISLVVCMFGMDSVLVKNISIGYVNKDNSRIGNHMYTALWFNVPIAILIAILGISLSPWLSNNLFEEPLLKWPLMISFTAVIFQTLSRVYATGLTGFRKIWQSNLVNETLSSWIVALTILIIIAFDYKINVINIAVIFVCARIVVSFTVGAYWRKLFTTESKKEYNLKPMLKMALPMFLVSSTGVIASSTDVVMLGWLGSSVDIGFYSVAARLAFFVSFFLQISNAAIAPSIAALYANNKKKALKTLVDRVTIGLTFLALLIFALFVLFGKYILSFWGEEFTDAYWLLIILGFGQLLNIATGPCGTLLVMCGKEKIHSKISFGGMCINIILNLILITRYGVIGAAIATAITVFIENSLKLYFSKRIFIHV